MPNHIWQMDHVPNFGKSQYVHVSVDTFSHLIFASAHSGEKVKDVKSLCFYTFAYMGVPKQLKTDNGPAYMSSEFKQFCEAYDITLKTGILYNPQGQAVVECTHTLKSYLDKVKKGHSGAFILSPHASVAYILYILIFLTVDFRGWSAADCHWQPPIEPQRMVC